MSGNGRISDKSGVVDNTRKFLHSINSEEKGFSI